MKILLNILLVGLTALSFCTYADDCKDDERLFEHELLVTEPLCIPKNPQRIVALDIGAVEIIMFSNRKLIGTSSWLLRELPVLYPEYKDSIPNIEDIGFPANLEKLLLLKPDIILAVGGADGISRSIDPVAAQKIAPTVVANTLIYEDWKLGGEFWASVLQEKPLFEHLLANYRQRVAEVQDMLGDNISQSVSIMSNSSYGKYLWLKDTPPAAIVSDVGLRRPPAQDYDKNSGKDVYKNPRYPMISEERLDLAEADAVFVFGYATSDKKIQKKEERTLEKLKSNPIWKTLKVVRNNKAFYVGGHWWRCSSYTLANRVLDDIGKYLGGKLPATPAIVYPIK